MNARTILILLAIAGGVLFAAIVAVCGGLALLAPRTSEAMVAPTVDAVILALNEDRLVETYDTHTSAELQRVMSREEYSEIGHNLKARLGSLKSKKVRQFHVRRFNTKTSVNVVYEGEFERGRGTIAIQLRKQGNQWLIDGLTINSPELLKDVATVKCPHCGEPHMPDARFCPHCGKPLAKAETP